MTTNSMSHGRTDYSEHYNTQHITRYKLSYLAMVSHLWPIRFQLMALLCILKGFRELPNPGIGSRVVAEEKVVVVVQCDGLCVAVNGLEEIATNRVHAGGERLREEVKSSVCVSVTCVSMCCCV